MHLRRGVRAVFGAPVFLALVACSGGDGRPRDGGSVDLDGARPPDTRWLFHDAGPLPDFGPPPVRPVCGVGGPCTPDRGCRVGTCVPEVSVEVGVGSAECPTRLQTFFTGGYCTPSPFADRTKGCNPDDPAACGDPECARCAEISGGVMCVRRCTPSASDNGECAQETQTCRFEGFCFDGCQHDEECRTYVDERGTTCRDTTSAGFCNRETRRCDHPSGGTPAGGPCERDSQCEENGICRRDWPAGYCTRLGCDVRGISCEGDGKCQQRRVGPVAMCGRGCVVGAERDDPAAVVGIAGHGDGCRPGYACIWDGVRGADTGNGICAEGFYTDRTTPNVGSPCDATTWLPDCYSPFGQGICLGGPGTSWDPHGYCSILDCAAPGMPAAVCGPGALCLPLPDLDATSVCLQTCTTADACTPGLACLPTSVLGGTGPESVCMPICTTDSQCRATDVCSIPPGAPAGRCESR